LTGYKLIFVPI